MQRLHKKGKEVKRKHLLYVIVLKKHIYIYILLIALSTELSAQFIVPNVGQWESAFAYKWENNNGSIFIEENGITFHLIDFAPLEYHHDHYTNDDLFDYSTLNHHAFTMRFVNGSSENWHPLQKQKGYHNYILGNDPNRWKSKVPVYQAVIQQEIYKGIDIKYYIDGSSIKYDLDLKAGVSPEVIQMNYTGLDTLYLEEGYLIMRTSVGEIIEQKPVAWQTVNGEKEYVKCNFVLEENTVSFELKKINPELPLTIDPQYIFSTFSGSTADNFGYTACFDSSGNMYSAGIAFGAGYPTNIGAFQDTFSGGSFDIAVTKFNAKGTAIIYSTYIGGNKPEQPHSMVASNDDGLVIMGVTGSKNYPVTPNALDTSFNGGPSVSVGFMTFNKGVDIVVTHLDSTGGVLVGSTFIGGTDTDGANKKLSINYGDNARGEVIYDSTFIHVATSTFSNDFMGGNWGTFSTQNATFFSLNDDCSASPKSKVFLGAGHDAGYGIRVMRENGRYFIVMAGGTKSTNLPTSANAYQKTYAGGSMDGFILKYDWALDAIAALTYNGTSAYDQNYLVEIDRDNYIYVFGQTLGAYPVSNGVWSIPNSSQYIHKFSANLSNSNLSTVFGNGQRLKINISPTAFMVDKCKNVYLSGWGGNVGNQPGNTIGLPTTPDARDSTTDGNDFYFLVLDGSWKMLEYASFFGKASSEHLDGGTSRFSNDGTIYQAICAGCGKKSFPTFPANAYSHVNGSNNCNLGSTKIVFNFQDPLVNVTVNPDTSCIPYVLQFTNNSKNVDVLIWNFGDGSIDTGFNPVKVYTDTGYFTITVIGIDTLCQTYDTIQMKIRLNNNFVTPQIAILPYDTCAKPYTIKTKNNTKGATNYLWSFGDGGTSTLKEPTYTYNASGTYTVQMIAFDGICNSSDTLITEVGFKKAAEKTDFSIDQDLCISPFKVTLSQLGNGFQTHVWDMGDGTTRTGNLVVHTYTTPGVYTITLTSTDSICNVILVVKKEVFVSIEFDETKLMPNVFTPNGDGTNDLLKIISPEMLNTVSSFNIIIFNRWGDVVFSSDDYRFTWDGLFENKEVSDGVYLWLVSTFDDCRKNKEYKGVVHVIR